MLTDEQREQLQLIQRCDPSFLLLSVKEHTNFDSALLEKVFELAKEQAGARLAASAVPADEGREPTGDELRKLVREIRDASGGPSDAPQPADYVLGGWRAAIATAPTMSEAARDVLAERRRQIEQEGWTLKHDDEHDGGQLPMAAASYAVAASYASAGLFPMPKGAPPTSWPWRKSWWKPTTPRRDLVKAGALILAEIERIDRKSAGGSDE